MMTPEDNDFEIRQWRISTAQWLGTDGANWRGDENRAHAMLVMLDELHLTDAEDKVAALTQAYEELRRRGLIEEEKL